MHCFQDFKIKSKKVDIMGFIRYHIYIYVYVPVFDYDHQISCIYVSDIRIDCRIPRLLLTELSFFGGVSEMSFQDRLAVAYKDFKNWRRANKVHCSHPLFTPNSVTCTCTSMLNISCTAGFFPSQETRINIFNGDALSKRPSFRFGKRRQLGPIYRAKLTIAVC